MINILFLIRGMDVGSSHHCRRTYLSVSGDFLPAYHPGEQLRKTQTVQTQYPYLYVIEMVDTGEIC